MLSLEEKLRQKRVVVRLEPGTLLCGEYFLAKFMAYLHPFLELEEIQMLETDLVPPDQKIPFVQAPSSALVIA